jgi:hypothetical protein
MPRVNLEIYSDSKREDLELLLKEFASEVFNTNTVNIDEFVNNHWVIYMAYIEDKAVGFASIMYNTYFGLRPPTAGCTYLYVKPQHRNSKANYLLNIQLGILCLDNNLPLENYYATENSARIGRKMKGKTLYTAVEYPVEEVKALYSHLTNKVKVKRIK